MTTPLDYQAPGPQPGGIWRFWKSGELIAWGVILVATLILAIGADFSKRRPAALNDDNIQVMILARYAVGANALLSAVPTAAMTRGQLLAALDKAAVSPADRLRAAIIAGDLLGSEAALRRIALLRGVYPDAHRDDLDALAACYGRNESPVSAEAVKAFDQRYGWLAALAHTHGLDESDPRRQEVVAPGIRTLATIVLVFILAGVAFVGGLVLFIIGCVRRAQRKLTLAFAGSSDAFIPDRSALVVGFAIYLGGMLGLTYAFRYGLHFQGLWTALALPVCFFLAVLWIFLRSAPGDWRQALGLHTGAGLLREIGCGFLGYLAGFPVFVVGVIITAVLTQFAKVDASHPIVKEILGDTFMRVTIFLLAVVWAPITEELMFRGALFASLRERFGWLISAPIVALLFAAIHPQGWTAIPALSALALIFAGIREWRGSIVACVTAHAINNGVALTFFLLIAG